MCNSLFFLMDKALLSIHPAGRGQSLKKLITLVSHILVYFDKSLHTYTFNCLTTDL